MSSRRGPMIVKVPTVADLLPLCVKLYERHTCGCCLHIVLDDGNVEDHNVEYCQAYAKGNGCDECETLGALLRAMPETGREQLVAKLNEVQFGGR